MYKRDCFPWGPVLMTCTESRFLPLSVLSITVFVQKNERVNKFSLLSLPVCKLMIQPEVLEQGKKTPGSGRKLTCPPHCLIPCHFLPGSSDSPRGRQGEDGQGRRQGQEEGGPPETKIILYEAMFHLHFATWPIWLPVSSHTRVHIQLSC